MTSTSRHERRIAMGAIVGLWAAYFAPQLLSSGVPFRRDTLLLYLPIRQFLHESLRSGRLPEWFPYEGLGVPFIGQFVTATFHPQTLLFLPFSPAIALKLNILGAYLLGLAGGYRFARALGASRLAAVSGGSALAFSGYALSMSDNLPYLMALATLPWLGWASARVAQRERFKDAAVLGLIWALLLLSGDVQSFVAAPVVIGATLTATRLALRGCALCLLSLGLALTCSAVELLPAMTVFGHSVRMTTGFIMDASKFWALHPMRLLELVVPHFLPLDAQPGASELLFDQAFRWSATLFTGSLVLLLSAAALTRKRTALPFAVVAAFALVMAMGSRMGLLPVLWTVLPPLSHFRFPEKHVVLFVVALVPLVASGTDAVRQNLRSWGRRLVVVSLVVAISALAVRAWPVVEGITAALGHVKPANAYIVGLTRISWTSGLAETALILATLGVFLWTGARRSWSAIAIPAAICLELWLGNHDFLPLVPAELIAPHASLMADALVAPSDQPPPRVISAARSRNYTGAPDSAIPSVQAAAELLRPDLGGIFHVSTIGASALPGQSDRARVVLGVGGVHAAEVGPIFGACGEIVDADERGIKGRPIRARDETNGLALVDTSCRLSAYLASARSVSDSTASAASLPSLGADEIVWEGGPTVVAQGGKVSWSDWVPGRFSLSIDALTATALVVSESFADGWSATVDGSAVPIFPTNGLAMGVKVEAGHHLAVFQYRTPRLRVGAAISLLGVLLCLLLVLSTTGRMKGRPHK